MDKRGTSSGSDRVNVNFTRNTWPAQTCRTSLSISHDSLPLANKLEYDLAIRYHAATICARNVCPPRRAARYEIRICSGAHSEAVL
jgi:hypothetical protein